MIVAVNDGRASVAVGVTEDLVGASSSAVDLLKIAVATLGGHGGGGRPDMAQGGGPDGAKGRRRSRGGQSRDRQAERAHHREGGVPRSQRLEFEPGLDPEDPGFVDEAGQIVEIDPADRLRRVGDVAHEARNIEAIGLIPDAQAALEQTLALKLDRFVQEEVDLRAIRPIGIAIELTIDPIGTLYRAVQLAIQRGDCGRLLPLMLTIAEVNGAVGTTIGSSTVHSATPSAALYAACGGGEVRVADLREIVAEPCGERQIRDRPQFGIRLEAIAAHVLRIQQPVCSSLRRRPQSAAHC